MTHKKNKKKFLAANVKKPFGCDKLSEGTFLSHTSGLAAVVVVSSTLTASLATEPIFLGGTGPEIPHGC